MRLTSFPARLRAGLAIACALVLGLITSACIHVFNSIEVREITAGTEETDVKSPLKAHLRDGSTVVYPTGAVVTRTSIRGDGQRYTATLAEAGHVTTLALDSVVGVEAYETKTNAATTMLVSTLATGAFVAGSALAAVAIFGSCPTYYSDSAGTAVLEGEGFSYSIAPLFERRDVDRLHVGAGRDGELRVEVRNEALETHYLNHVELLEVTHASNEVVVPEESGQALALRDLFAPATARDRAGRDVRATIAGADGMVFSTDSGTLARARVGDLDDYVDLTFPAAGAADSVAIFVRARNSLLNTVLLYDGILSGARALDWVNHDLNRLSSAAELGRWYVGHMGMRVLVKDGDGWRDVARIGDTGPIAFHDVAIIVPVVRTHDSVHVRIAFTADNWRIDRIAVAGGYRRPPMRTISISSVMRDDGTPDAAVLASLRAPDDAYLRTSPGQTFSIHFATGVSREPRTFFLASQGYYTEWIRGDWLKERGGGIPFVASDDAVVDALHRWRTKQHEFEGKFYSSRVPTQ
ncbi:MAG: hypothetical protein M3081_13430 [Gemmatimonadota bacterium]|nr:hypothetical protein [Gemmatimonadota bacterium]